MKKLIRTSVQLALMILFTVSAFAEEQKDLTLTYRQLKGSNVLEARLNTERITYSLQLRQLRDGYFLLKSPPFLVAEIGQTFHIGELKDTGLLSLLLNPMTAEMIDSGFRKNRNLLHITSPSQSPTLSGIAFTLDHIDLLLLNPMFNTETPLGQGIIAGKNNVYAGLLYASRDDRSIHKIAQQYLLDWKRLGIGRNMIFSLIGACSKNGPIASSAYAQGAWDPALGGGITIGWKISLHQDSLTVDIEQRLGGQGIQLKKLSEGKEPTEATLFELVLGNTERSISLSYRSKTYERPVFGGQSQKRELDFRLSGTFGPIQIIADNTTDYDVDFGKIECTEYMVRLDGEDGYVSAGFIVNRNIGAKSTATGASLSIKAPKASFELQNGKARLEFRWNQPLKKGTLTFSIDQDRYVSVSFSTKGL